MKRYHFARHISFYITDNNIKSNLSSAFNDIDSLSEDGECAISIDSVTQTQVNDLVTIVVVYTLEEL